jgi:surfactin synthase thioesterase subunit
MDRDAWLRRFRPAPAAPVRLVCFPHAGGSANYFMAVARAMAPAVDVVSVQYPGRQDRRGEPCVATIDELADLVVRVLDGGDERPVAFFGHSMGATLAFEVALRMGVAGGEPAMLFASGRRAPSTARVETVHLGGRRGILAELRALQGTESQLLDDPEVLEMVLPALVSDYRAIETYGPRTEGRLGCPIVALVGGRDPKVTEAEARAWQLHTTGGFELRVFPGGHFYLTEHSTEVIGLISARLAGLSHGNVGVPALME